MQMHDLRHDQRSTRQDLGRWYSSVEDEQWGSVAAGAALALLGISFLRPSSSWAIKIHAQHAIESVASTTPSLEAIKDSMVRQLECEAESQRLFRSRKQR